MPALHNEANQIEPASRKQNFLTDRAANLLILIKRPTPADGVLCIVAADVVASPWKRAHGHELTRAFFVTGQRLARRDKRSWQSAVTLTRINYGRSSQAICHRLYGEHQLWLLSHPMRISEAQMDFVTRTQELNRALALAKEALGTQEDFEEPFHSPGFG